MFEATSDDREGERYTNRATIIAQFLSQKSLSRGRPGSKEWGTESVQRGLVQHAPDEFRIRSKYQQLRGGYASRPYI